MRGASGSSGARNFFVFPRYGSGILHAPQASQHFCDGQLWLKCRLLCEHISVWYPGSGCLHQTCVLLDIARSIGVHYTGMLVMRASHSEDIMPICYPCTGLRSPVRLSKVCESTVICILLWIYRASFNLQCLHG